MTSISMEMLPKIIEGKIDANRKFVDQVLERIDAKHRYYFQKLVIELQRMEIEEKAGNLQAAFRHKVLAKTYTDILKKTFGLA